MASASKGLHMVSAVHPHCRYILSISNWASKGLHMVSAVHPAWNDMRSESRNASKGLHMVSAVHHGIKSARIVVFGFKGAAHG